MSGRATDSSTWPSCGGPTGRLEEGIHPGNARTHPGDLSATIEGLLCGPSCGSTLPSLLGKPSGTQSEGAGWSFGGVCVRDAPPPPPLFLKKKNNTKRRWFSGMEPGSASCGAGGDERMGPRRVPADLCCSSQDYVDRTGAGLEMELRGKQSHGGGGAPRSSFIIPPRVSGERSRVGEGAAGKFQMSSAGEELGAHPSRTGAGRNGG